MLATVIVCSGCLDSTPATQPTPGPPPASAAPSAPQAAPAALTKAQAARRYLRIVEPYNAALERFETAAHANRPWTDLRLSAARIVKANTTQIQALRGTHWPTETRVHVRALIAVSLQAGRYWNATAKATSPAQFQTAALKAAKLSGKREATALRKALGLPPYREP
ncbi:hypothetical protein [Actinomadura alba]|uniref:Lipoprotein n=1 Tax=Actinomadura alba TaxID=406431 RepID=A0ABR7LRM6_9ACTN|nr:hypothetical protein [Actinomadura alba]MBC6467498.1 hypothetical protein [Actinomadura alba]